MSLLLKLNFCVFFVFHVFGILNAHTTPPSSKWLEPYRITITNREVPQVVVGCDDRGAEVIHPGESVSWKFRMDFFGANKYNCRFYWFEGNNSVTPREETTFPVFDDEIIKLCGNSLFSMNRCYWSITRIGFYFSKIDASWPNYAWRIMHTWRFGN
ncbi:putative plant self-incompatibility S1 [Helianthus annuus]|nr:putative plant self-incompatibility S1 [Helianthus annuus]KAJ0499566.1 putative plant self-incompatibility S1 [Helianthus annuus]KAJ0665580.1 putative plant self-incompatibility S1 [Helianthus annuus]KAJ0673028.1 putative plant self-incompatibility S1 [Helianthus annuus]